jgi:hypothetical protein
VGDPPPLFFQTRSDPPSRMENLENPRFLQAKLFFD